MVAWVLKVGGSNTQSAIHIISAAEAVAIVGRPKLDRGVVHIVVHGTGLLRETSIHDKLDCLTVVTGVIDAMEANIR